MKIDRADINLFSDHNTNSFSFSFRYNCGLSI